MKTATVSAFRANMKEHLDGIEKDQDVLILSGPKKKDFVLITLEQFNSMEETAHLLSTPANTERLMESIAQDKAGQRAHTLELPGKVSVSKNHTHTKQKQPATTKIRRHQKQPASTRRRSK